MFENIPFRPITMPGILDRTEDRVELPCKDMDMDCLPDKEGFIPFGNYAHCYIYAPEKGMCPFLPIAGK